MERVARMPVRPRNAARPRAILDRRRCDGTAAGVASERSPTPEPEGDVVGQRAEDADRKRAP